MAKKADLKQALAKAEMLGAKGMLDPKIYSDWNQKNFDDKLYYRQFQAKVKVPTRLGIDVVGGYEYNDGIYLNPEQTTGDYGLWHFGLEANVLQGLLVNERRTAMQQAEVYQELAKNEQQIILNDLVYHASVAYLVWQQYVYFDEVLLENVSIASSYFANTKQSFFSGEKTAMDTLEAFIAYQDALLIRQKNETGLIKSRQQVENYLWENGKSVSLEINSKPEDYKNQILPEMKDLDNTVLEYHPALLSSVNKLSMLEMEQKLKREKLKPKLKIKYNPLLAISQDNEAPVFSMTNVKWGFDFSMPLLLRSERAGIQRGAIKIQETQLDLQNKTNELQNKIQNSWEQQLLLREQLLILAENVASYKRLLDGEQEKFNYGESSVFLLNKRQEKYIGGQLKLIGTSIKRQIALLDFLYFSNQLVVE